MNQVNRFFKLVYESVETDIVKHNYEESVQHSDGMVWLPLSNVCFVITHNEKSLRKLYVMDEANQLILAVSKHATKSSNAVDTEAPLK